MYTRVTEVLSPFSGLHNIPKHILQNAADRGTRVHEICEGIVNGLGEWNVDETTSGYVESFKQWWSLGHTVTDVEQRFYDDDLMITGQVDLILETPTGHAIVDLKTSSKPSNTWPLQGAAYAHLARSQGFKIDQIIFLHLDKNGGKPGVIVYPDDFDTFKKCLDIYRYFNG